ncbi:MAG: transglutaminase family protein [Thermodesulfobacteriota bacterium]
MLFKIQHRTHYKYGRPVSFKPHFLRFRPRDDSFQKLLDFNISISPEPKGISEHVDLDGNTIYQVWFNGSSQELVIQSTALIKTKNRNPFNYLVHPERALILPMEYPKDIDDFIKPYTAHITNSMEVLRFAEGMACEVGHQTIPFLIHLTQEINHKFRNEYREFGEPYPPQKTLVEKRGSCRDLVVLFIETCRMLGLAARFVSGYYFDKLHTEKLDLHSWAEVYVPGGGWRGFDPSTGLATADRHIAVSASSIPRLSAPVTGTYLGETDSTLTTDITISAL